MKICFVFLFIAITITLAAQADSSRAILADTSVHARTRQMKDVVITNDPTAENVIPTITEERIDFISTKELERNPVSNVFDALTYSKGVYCDIDQGMTNPVDININGLEGNYTLFYVDNVPAMNNLAGIFALNAFPVSMIREVEIEKGSNSMAFGSGAIAGLVNIVTKEPATAPTLALDFQFASKLESTMGITAAFHLKKVHTLFSVSTNNMNYRWDINHDNFTDIPLVNRVAIFNKWSFIRKKYRIANITARYLFEDRFTGQMNTPGRLTGSDAYYTQWLRTNQWQVGFQYQLPIDERILIRGNYAEHYQQAWFDTIHYYGVLRNAFANVDWDKHVSGHHLTVGASYRLDYYSDNTGLSNQALTGIGPNVHTVGIYIRDVVNFQFNSWLVYGLRFDYSNASGPIAVPRLAYTWEKERGNNIGNMVQLSLGTGYRVPNVLNEGFTALETSRQVMVPEKLKTEYSVSMNFDYTRRQRFSAGQLKFEGGIFGVYLTNFVEPDYETDSAAVIYSNNHGGGSFGCNAALDWSFKFPLTLGFNCTYAFTFELDGDGDDIDVPTHAPPFTANFYVGYTVAKPQITFDLTANLISPMLLATVPNDFRPSQSPWFSIMNIQVTKKFKKGFELFAGVKNLLNFVQRDPILRPFDPFNRTVAINNPNHYFFDTTYAYSTIEGVKGFIGFRYTLK